MDALGRGVDFVMVARGAQGDPFIFHRMEAAWRGEPVPPLPSLAETVAMMDAQIALMCSRKSEAKAMPEARKHILWYLKGIRGAKPFKLAFSTVKTLAEFRAICRRMLETLEP